MCWITACGVSVNICICTTYWICISVPSIRITWYYRTKYYDWLIVKFNTAVLSQPFIFDNNDDISNIK